MSHRKLPTRTLVFIPLLFASVVTPQAAFAGFTIGPDASNFALLFEGAGGNTLQITNVTINGNVGVGLTGLVHDSGPSNLNGGLYFSAANTGQLTNSGNPITGGVHYSNLPLNVTSALNTVNSLNTSLGGESGAGIGISGTTTINASAGTLDANGNRVFDVTSFNTTNGDVLTINGDGAGDSVVLNFFSAVNFNNQVKLVGISPDQVLFNFVGGSGLTGGPTLQINDNLSNNTPNCSLGQYCVQGIFLDPNGAISVTNANVVGRVFGGDTHDFQYVSGSTITSHNAVPEPNSIIILIAFMLAITIVASRKRAARS